MSFELPPPNYYTTRNGELRELWQVQHSSVPLLGESYMALERRHASHSSGEIQKWPRDRAVANFRIATGYDCQSKHLNMIDIAQSPVCKLCDSNEKWTPFIWHDAAHSALDACEAGIGTSETK
ncbi:hypothetical protein TNCV_3052201 [Trichonephila clavipes]|nr:hypothetical protein TNCV_3052201 [Trichonephila clavipes]